MPVWTRLLEKSGMTSLLRQIVASPRVRHADTGLDLCYVTPNIIVTSGPSQSYPKRAYRTPLNTLVSFLDERHDKNWAIWEFRAEGTGYPDEAVYGRILHYPWPDHHPPPFRLVPLIMASMRNWLHGGELKRGAVGGVSGHTAASKGGSGDNEAEEKNNRVVVVHCKAGKGRSGMVTCSYLIAECGWAPSDALARFTQRRMRPGFGEGVSIPSQRRWVTYVERWTKHGKRYVDREVEIVEIHVWGMRDAVRIFLEGFTDEGKKIKTFHVFGGEEKIVVDGPGMSTGSSVDGESGSSAVESEGDASAAESVGSTKSKTKKKAKEMIRSLSKKGWDGLRTDTSGISSPSPSSTSSAQTLFVPPSRTESPVNNDAPPEITGGSAVILKPSSPIIIPTSDVKISARRSSKAPTSMGPTFVTSVAHAWFNAFFEGNGPERDGKPEASGVFEIGWDEMDGLKGLIKTPRSFDKIAVVWKAVGVEEEVRLPEVVEDVKEVRPADWKGEEDVYEEKIGGEVDGKIDAEVEAGERAAVKCSGPEGEEIGEDVGRQDEGGAQDPVKDMKTTLL